MHDSQKLTIILNKLSNLDIDFYLFGGWAEELLGISPPRLHRDVDLLYTADNFENLDSVLRDNPEFDEIIEKRFSHKRAYIYQAVMIEFFLVRGTPSSTLFFDNYEYKWPTGKIGSEHRFNGLRLNIACKAYLEAYRRDHSEISKWSFFNRVPGDQ